jgi:hypothetical protein
MIPPINLIIESKRLEAVPTRVTLIPGFIFKKMF